MFALKIKCSSKCTYKLIGQLTRITQGLMCISPVSKSLCNEKSSQIISSSPSPRIIGVPFSRMIQTVKTTQENSEMRFRFRSKKKKTYPLVR